MQTEKEPLISVIIPVYQVEKYLKRCLESIAAQTYQNREVVLVDDGSTDQSGRICDEFAKKYEDIFPVQVFHVRNMGAAAARNYGLKYAKGTLYTFMDSDDELAEDFLEVTERVMRERKVRLVQTSFTSEEKVYRSHQTAENPKVTVYTNEEAFKSYILDGEITGYIWGKLYDAALFEHVRYPEKITHGQDSYTTFKFLLLAKEMAFVDEKLYYYCRHEDTLTGTFSTKRIKLAGVSDEMRKFAKEEGFENIPDLKRLIDSYEVQMNFMIYNYYIGHRKAKEYREDLIPVKRALLRADYANPYIKRKYRKMHLLLKVSDGLYKFLSFLSQKIMRNRYW